MKITRSRLIALLAGFLLIACPHARGMSSTDRIAEPGEPVRADAGWPDGVRDFLNDPLRTIGWLSWFSELPNDVKHFAFKITTPADAQRLINAFAKIKSDNLIIRLAAEKGPIDPFARKRSRLSGFEFAIGDQNVVDAWFKRLQEGEPGIRKFGIHRLKKPHSAVPPSLTLYVENEQVSLDRLVIPLHVDLDTQFGLDAGWKANDGTKKWDPPPEEIVAVVEQHRARQKGMTKEK